MSRSMAVATASKAWANLVSVVQQCFRRQPGKSVSESVAAALEGRVRLLVVDNCEHVRDAAADLIEAILTPGCSDTRPRSAIWLTRRKIPIAACDKIARERLPQASFTILPGVGHVPMVDDPDLVARTILAVTGAG